MSTASVVSPLPSPSPAVAQIQSLLGLQGKVGKPSPQICQMIANLRDLCDLQTNGIGTDWRRGVDGEKGGNGGGQQGSGGARSFGAAGGGGSSSRPVFRNTGGYSSLPRVNSQRSFGSSSTASTGGGGPVGTGSPTAPAGAPGRYQSMFKNTSKPVEDKILNNIILSKLNKFSGQTYEHIRDFLYQILGSGEPDLADMIRDFMLLVFKKAAAEETFCPLYAKLLSEISQRYKVILEEMHKLQENYLDIFEDVHEVPEGGDNYKEFLDKNEQKQYRQGYSQFLAECAALEILELSHLQRTFEHLFSLMLKYGKAEGKKALLDEYADCLMRMSKVLSKRNSAFFIGARKTLHGASISSLTDLIQNKQNYPSLSPKARCILMNVKDFLGE